MMSPALKAMVEAMAAELTRQSHEDDGAQRFPAVGDLKDSRLLGFDGMIDLEQVARAGLKAIQTLDESTIAVGAPLTGAHHGPCDPAECAQDTFVAMIDAILKDQP